MRYRGYVSREVNIRLVDDFDPSLPADEVCAIGWEGYDYVIDLTKENADELREILKPYFEASHERVKQPKKTKQQIDAMSDGQPKMPSPRQNSSFAVPDKELRLKIREWARGQGLKVGEKGIISSSIVDSYYKSHRKSKSVLSP